MGYIPTVQLKISTKKLNFEDTHVKLVIWDVGGQVTHMSPYRNDFYEGAQSAIIVDLILNYINLFFNIVKKIG